VRVVAAVGRESSRAVCVACIFSGSVGVSGLAKPSGALVFEEPLLPTANCADTSVTLGDNPNAWLFNNKLDLASGLSHIGSGPYDSIAFGVASAGSVTSAYVVALRVRVFFHLNHHAISLYRVNPLTSSSCAFILT
jgi:hypothetical protein